MSKIHNLPYGAITKVADEMHVSPSLVAKVARGERNNVIIREALLRLAKEHAASMKRIQRLQALIKK